MRSFLLSSVQSYWLPRSDLPRSFCQSMIRVLRQQRRGSCCHRICTVLFSLPEHFHYPDVRPGWFFFAFRLFICKFRCCQRTQWCSEVINFYFFFLIIPDGFIIILFGSECIVCIFQIDVFVNMKEGCLSETTLFLSQADIRNPLRYLLITE